MPDVLRQSAVEAALSVLAGAPHAARRLIDAAERASRGEAVDLADVRAPLSGTACAASLIGLKHGAANAAAFLAAWSACAPDAESAAADARRFASLYATLSTHIR